MADNVLRSFLVSIGYKVDGSSEKKFTESLTKATITANLLAKAIEETARAVVIAAARMAAGFEDLFYASQRTNASIQNLRGLSYAVSQLGGTYSSAMASVEAFARQMRTNPGYESLARGLGVATRENGKLRDTVDILGDLGRVFARQPYYVAFQYAQALGLDETTFRLLRDQPEALARYRKEYEETTRRIGLNSKDAAEKSTALMQALRSLQLSATAVAEKLLTDLAPALIAIVEKVRAWLEANPERIREILDGISQAAVALAAGFMKVVDALAPVAKGLTDLAASVSGKDGLQTVLEAFAIWLTTVWMVKILAAFTGVSAGWAAMLLRFGIVGAGAVAGGAAAGYGISQLLGGTAPTDARSWQGPSGAENAIAPRPSPGDNRNLWQRIAPKWLGGRDAPTASGGAAPGGTPETKPSGQGLGDGGGLINGLNADQSANYADILGKRESGNRHGIRNEYGFSGRFQMGAAALKDTGYVTTARNGELTDPTVWTGKNGIRNLDEFLANKESIQERQFLEYTNMNANRLRKMGVLTEGMTAEQVAGFLAAAHLKGPGGAMALSSGRSTTDANGTSTSSYFRMMAGINAARKKEFDLATTAATIGRYNFSGFDAARMGGGLGTGPVDNSTRSITQTNKTEIVVQGGNDPQATANAIAGAQSRVNDLSLRNAQGAVR